MKTLQIEIPKGFKVESFDETSGLLKFQPIPQDIKERIQKLDDVIDYLGANDPDVLDYLELQKLDIENHILAYQTLVIIVKAYNEKKEPDYNDSSQTKYHPRFKLSSSGGGFSYYDCGIWDTSSGVGSRLDFLDFDNMKDAVKKFLPIYQRWAQKQ